ncbi:hypothetical protein PAGU2595_025020 [Lysobacter xanthus]
MKQARFATVLMVRVAPAVTVPAAMLAGLGVGGQRRGKRERGEREEDEAGDRLHAPMLPRTH